MTIHDLPVDMTGIDNEYLLSDNRLENTLANLREIIKSDSIIAQKKLKTINITAANLTHDLEFLAARIERNQPDGHAVIPLIRDVLQNTQEDKITANWMSMLTATANRLDASISELTKNDPRIMTAIQVYKSDLSTLIHSCQILNALHQE